MLAVTAVAHRGDPYRFRENTLPSLRSAFARGADAVEIDVRVTGDGQPVLLHDATLERLWGERAPLPAGGMLSALTAAQVREVSDGGVPTLAEALAVPSGTDGTALPDAPERRVLIDLPGASPAAVRRILGAVRDAGAAERAYYCGDAPAMLAVRAADPAAETALTWTSLAPPRAALLAAVRPRWLNYRFPLVDRALVEHVHRQGHLLSVWTPDTGRAMRRLLGLGVDSITTNRVGTLCAVRARQTR